MENIREKNRSIVVLRLFVIVLGIMTAAFAVLYAMNRTNYETVSISLENIYERSFYDLVENVNNAEVKLSKLLSSKDKDDGYCKNILSEVQENTNNAQISLSYLPVSMNGMPDTIKFINQLDGYTSTLEKKEKLSSEDIKTLNELHASLVEIKNKLNDMSNEMVNGYNILANSRGAKQDYNGFTKFIGNTNNEGTEFPTMIYDGPFSDTVLNRKVKGLNFEEVSEEKTRELATNLYEGSKISYAGETNGKFSTYDYNISYNGVNSYAQITKNGGKLLTLSSYSNGDDAVSFTKEQAIEIAEEFAREQGIQNVETVWSDMIDSDFYVNLAPTVNKIIYYPDLVKVKVDLSSGKVIGWEATPYYANHTERSLPKVVVSADKAKNRIDEAYTIEQVRLALSPIENTNQEILTHEIRCSRDQDTYYFYIDVQTGETVNVLRVIETDNGSLLM